MFCYKYVCSVVALGIFLGLAEECAAANGTISTTLVSRTSSTGDGVSTYSPCTQVTIKPVFHVTFSNFTNANVDGHVRVFLVDNQGNAVDLLGIPNKCPVGPNQSKTFPVDFGVTLSAQAAAEYTWTIEIRCSFDPNAQGFDDYESNSATFNQD